MTDSTELILYTVFRWSKVARGCVTYLKFRDLNLVIQRGRFLLTNAFADAKILACREASRRPCPRIKLGM
jgi:hypothetical protein